jgi:hypothetical protein
MEAPANNNGGGGGGDDDDVMIIDHHVVGQGSYVCRHCRAMFETRAALREHALSAQECQPARHKRHLSSDTGLAAEKDGETARGKARPQRKKPRPATVDKPLTHILDHLALFDEALEHLKAHSKLMRATRLLDDRITMAQQTIEEATVTLAKLGVEKEKAKQVYIQAKERYETAESAVAVQRQAVNGKRAALDKIKDKIDGIKGVSARIGESVKGVMSTLFGDAAEPVTAQLTVNIVDEAGQPIGSEPGSPEFLARLFPGLIAKGAVAVDELKQALDSLDRATLARNDADTETDEALRQTGILNEQIHVQQQLVATNTDDIATCRSEKKAAKTSYDNKYGGRRRAALPEPLRAMIEETLNNPALTKQLAALTGKYRNVNAALTVDDPYVLNEAVLVGERIPPERLPAEPCVICIGEFDAKDTSEAGRVARTPCNHYFHVKCLNALFAQNVANFFDYIEHKRAVAACPCCRANVATDEIRLVGNETTFYF